MMSVSTNGNPYTANVSCYGYTNASDKKDMTTWYNEVSSLVGHIPKLNSLIIGGSMNAQMSKDKNT